MALVVLVVFLSLVTEVTEGVFSLTRVNTVPVLVTSDPVLGVVLVVFPLHNKRVPPVCQMRL